MFSPAGVGIVGYGTVELFAQSDTSSNSSVFVQNSSGAYARLTPGSGVQAGSKEKFKKNIKILKNGIDILKTGDIYSFNLKDEKDTEVKHFGFVIGDKYKTPSEVINQGGDGIDIYSMAAILWKAIQELNQKVEALEVNRT